MKLIGFRTPKPRQFNYKPVFYNKEQEEFENRLHDTRKREMETSSDLMLREKMRNSWRLKEKQERKRTGIRNLMIAIFLILLTIYFIFFA
jgi:hypothetical protein